jgi:SNF2 family DNA or RNA helicase
VNKDVAELETKRLQYLEAAESKRAQIAKLIGELAQDEKVEQKRKVELAKVKRQQEEEEARQQSQEQATAVAEEIAELEEYYRTKAINKPWYDGNDDVEPILPFQWRGALFGAGAKRWILGDGMGLGKTRQSIGWLDLVDAEKVLIVCQADICDQFAGELMALAPHRTVFNMYKKNPKTRHAMMDEILNFRNAVVVVNYEIWRKDKPLLAKLAKWQIDTMIVDEAHNLKNTATSNYRYIKELSQVDNKCPQCGGLIYGLYDEDKKPRLVPKPCPACGWKKGDSPEYVYQLDAYLESKSMKNMCFTTGTPILNSPIDIFSLLHLCDPVLFASKNRYLSTFCVTNYHNGKVEFKSGQLNRLKPLIAGRFIARDRDDAGITLPVQRKHIVRVDIDKETYPKQYKVIRQLSEHATIMLESGEMMTIMHLIALITRKRQANVYPAGIELTDSEGNVIFSVGQEVTESVKFDYVLENMLKIHAEGRRQVVFSQFSTALEAFKEVLEEKGFRVAVLTGATPRKLRDEIKNNFYLARGEVPKWDVILCNYKTGGTGLNLTSATATHILDEEWNPGKRDQAYARTDRMGQPMENDVYIYRIPASIDTWMSNTIHRKEQMVSEFTGTMTDDEMTAESLTEAMRSGAIL